MSEEYYKINIQLLNSHETLYIKIKDGKLEKVFAHSRSLFSTFKKITKKQIDLEEKIN